MRLTNSLKDAFVRSVLNDVPLTDYRELLRELVMQDAIARLPDPVREIASNEKYQHFVADHYYHISVKPEQGYETYFGMSISIKMPSNEYIESHVIQERKRKYIEGYIAQEQRLAKLRRQLTDAINAITTVKRAKEVMPEFAKYLPSEDEKSTNLPTTIFSNLLDELRGAGFPKSGSVA